MHSNKRHISTSNNEMHGTVLSSSCTSNTASNKSGTSNNGTGVQTAHSNKSDTLIGTSDNEMHVLSSRCTSNSLSDVNDHTVLDYAVYKWYSARVAVSL